MSQQLTSKRRAWHTSGKIGYATQPSQNTRADVSLQPLRQALAGCALCTRTTHQKSGMHNANMCIARQRNLRLLAVCHSSEARPQLAAGIVPGHAGTFQLTAAKACGALSSYDRGHSTTQRIWETTIVLLGMPQVAKQQRSAPQRQHGLGFAAMYRLKWAAIYDWACPTHFRIRSKDTPLLREKMPYTE